MKRLAPFLSLLLVVAAVVAVAAFTVPSDAANVNGVTISQDTLNNDLHAIGSSSGFTCYLNAQVLVATQGRAGLPLMLGVGGTQDHAQSFSMQFTNYWLRLLIDGEVFEQAAAERHLSLTPYALAAGKADLAIAVTQTLGQVAGSQFQCLGSTQQVLGSVPASLVDGLSREQAAADLLAGYIAHRPLTQAALDAYFAKNKSAFDTVCFEAVGSTSQSQATTWRSELASGTPFATVAAAAGQPTSQPVCIAPSDPRFAELQAIAGGLQAGAVSQVFPSQGPSGTEYGVLQVTSRTPSEFATIVDVVRNAYLQPGRVAMGNLLAQVVKQATVTVNPRYGTWSSRAVDIVSPVPPPRNTLLSPTANLPSTQAARILGSSGATTPSVPSGAGASTGAGAGAGASAGAGGSAGASGTAGGTAGAGSGAAGNTGSGAAGGSGTASGTG